jgi:hypothetical protein
LWTSRPATSQHPGPRPGLNGRAMNLGVSMPCPCQNGRKTAVARGHSGTSGTASELGIGWLTRCVKHTSKQPVRRGMGPHAGQDVAITSGRSRSTTDRPTPLTSTCRTARRSKWPITDLPSWSCGFDSRRPPRGSGPGGKARNLCGEVEPEPRAERTGRGHALSPRCHRGSVATPSTAGTTIHAVNFPSGPAWPITRSRASSLRREGPLLSERWPGCTNPRWTSSSLG